MSDAPSTTGDETARDDAARGFISRWSRSSYAERVISFTLPEQVQAVRAQRARLGPVTPETIAQTFQGRRTKQIAEIIETLKILGQG